MNAEHIEYLELNAGNLEDLLDPPPCFENLRIEAGGEVFEVDYEVALLAINQHGKAILVRSAVEPTQLDAPAGNNSVFAQ